VYTRGPVNNLMLTGLGDTGPLDGGHRSSFEVLLHVSALFEPDRFVSAALEVPGGPFGRRVATWVAVPYLLRSAGFFFGSMPV